MGANNQSVLWGAKQYGPDHVDVFYLPRNMSLSHGLLGVGWNWVPVPLCLQPKP